MISIFKTIATAFIFCITLSTTAASTPAARVENPDEIVVMATRGRSYTLYFSGQPSTSVYNPRYISLESTENMSDYVMDRQSFAENFTGLLYDQASFADRQSVIRKLVALFESLEVNNEALNRLKNAGMMRSN